MVSPLHGSSPQASGFPLSGFTSGISLSSIASSVSSSQTSFHPNEELFSDTLSNVSGTGGLVIFSANNPKIPKPSLFSFMETVSLASVTNKDDSYTNSSTVSRVTANFYRNFIFNAAQLLKILFNILVIQEATQLIIASMNSQIGSENPLISSYNSGVASDNANSTTINNAANTFNTAYNTFQEQTTQYNNGQISAQEYAQDQATYNTALVTYNTAVNNYNIYAAGRNGTIDAYNNSVSAYNAQVEQNNSALASINQERAALGLPPIPLEQPISSVPSLASANTVPPAPATAPPQINATTIYLIPPYALPSDLVTTLFQTLMQNPIIGQIETGLNQIQNVRQFSDFYLRVKTSVFALPAAFSSQFATSDTTTTGTNSSAGLAAISGSLDPSVVDRLLNQGAQNAYYQAASSVLKPGTIDVTILASALALTNASLFSAQQLLQLLKGSTQQGFNQNSIDAALELGLASVLLDILSKNTLENNVSEDENNANALPFQSTENLNQLATAIGLFSLGLNLPGLGAQILGLSGLSDSELFNLTSNGIGFNNFIFNPFTQNFAASELAALLIQNTSASANLTPSEALTLQNNVQAALVQAASATSPLGGSNQFFNNLSTTLVSNGVTGPLSTNIQAAALTAFFEPAFTSQTGFSNNLQQSLISQGFSSSNAFQLASSIAGVAPGTSSDALLNVNNINTPLLAGNLAYNLQAVGVTTPSDVATQVITAFAKNTQEVNEATLRDNLVHELEVQNLTAEQARRVVAGTAIPLTSQNNPLVSSVATHTISRDALHAQLVSSIANVYNPLIGTQQAQVQASQLADQIVGQNPLSLVSLVHSHLNTLKNQQDQIYFDTAIENFQAKIKPSINYIAYYNQLVDPGKKYLYANNLMEDPSSSTGPVKMGGTNPALEIAV